MSRLDEKGAELQLVQKQLRDAAAKSKAARESWDAARREVDRLTAKRRELARDVLNEAAGNYEAVELEEFGI